jgi:hypothetical protein
MLPPALNHEKAQAHYDEATKIAHITYTGLLDAETSTAVYDWLADLVDIVGIEGIYGEIFDFRKVQEFMADNLMQARRSSRRYNMRHNVRRIPVAMIISNYYQEEILRGPMQNVEENKRKTIVWNPEDALAFLHEWHTSKQGGDDEGEES